MSDEVTVATGMIKHWETITGAVVGLLAIFGIVIGRKKGVSPVTTNDLALLELRIENRISQCASEIKKTISDSMGDIYDHVDKKDSHTNSRIDNILGKK